MNSIYDNSIEDADRMVSFSNPLGSDRVQIVVNPTIMEWDDEDHPDDWQEGPGEYDAVVALVDAGFFVRVSFHADSRAEALDYVRTSLRVEAYGPVDVA